MGKDEGAGYVFVNNRMLRRGHTTGTCAAAASKAAAMALMTGSFPETVEISTPGGVTLDLEVEDPKLSGGCASCAVRKNGGDDIDATHGTPVYSEVRLTDAPGVSIDGGKGVGRVTRRGLDQPVGAAAINHVPRSMIASAVSSVLAAAGSDGGAAVTISVPEGESIALRTFNPQLGIIGGISILGSSGIVEPMSEAALVETIRREMDVRRAEGQKTLLVVPGNYGMSYADALGGLERASAVKCSNFIGETLDYARESGFEGLLLVGNLGKLVKLAGGIMNTHSRNADSRMEIMAAAALEAGADAGTALKVLGCVATDDALDILSSAGLTEGAMERICAKIASHMDHRVAGGLRVGAVVFSSKYGELGRTAEADRLMEDLGL
jgi:cobalt-precorrin-5B (C1)-methyltransferase